MQHFKQTLNIRSIKRTLNASSKSLIIRFYLIISYNEPVPPSPFVDENCHFVANSYSRQQWSMLITFFRKSRFPNNLEMQFCCLQLLMSAVVDVNNFFQKISISQQLRQAKVCSDAWICTKVQSCFKAKFYPKTAYCYLNSLFLSLHDRGIFQKSFITLTTI